MALRLRRPRLTAERQAPARARRPERHRRRHHPDQHRRRHDHRLAPGRRGLVALLCRPPLPAAARHRRHRHRHRAAARSRRGRSAPAATTIAAPHPEPLARIRRGADPAGGGRAPRHSRADHRASSSSAAPSPPPTPRRPPRRSPPTPLGLPAFVAIKVLQPAFFAREDTRTPMCYGGVSMVVNVVAAFALFFLFGHVGIAAATSIAAWVNTGAARRARSSGAATSSPTRAAEAPPAAPRARLGPDGRRPLLSPPGCSRRGSAIRASSSRSAALAALVAIGARPLRALLPADRRRRFPPRRSRGFRRRRTLIAPCAAGAASAITAAAIARGI